LSFWLKWFVRNKNVILNFGNSNLFLGVFTIDYKIEIMEPKVSIIMGSTSDLGVMEAAAKIMDEFEIPFEINALSAHRTPAEVEKFAKGAKERGIKVIIAGAGMAAHLPGVIAAMTPLPVIGVPIRASLDGMDALLAIAQMPPGIPVATVAINGAQNAGILAAQMLSLGDAEMAEKMVGFKENLKSKIVKANQDLSEVKFKFKTN
jgi:5-(carboxyamino)imidazole ribonucleotide mutase